MVQVTPEQVLDILGVEYFPRTNRLAFKCPVHDDNDPSAGIYLDTGLAHCFSCEYTLDLVRFYAAARTGEPQPTREAVAEAHRDLEKRFGTLDEVKPRHDKKTLASARRKAETALAGRRDLDMRTHASLGETLDRILLAYERGQIDELKLDITLKTWYNKVEESVYATNSGGIPEAGPDGGFEEGPGDLLGFGYEDDGPDLEGDGSDGSIDLA